MTEIRRARREDHDDLLDLWMEAGHGRMSEEEWDAIIARPSTTVLVAEDAGRVAGAAIASFDGWRAYIYHVAVTPPYRRQGPARRLMAEAEEHVAREGGHRVYVMVGEENTAGLASPPPWATCQRATSRW